MDYNRMVAYIYSYNDGQKCKNTGFAKIEVRQDILKLQINMKGAYSENSYIWSVNLFYRKNARIIGIKLGDMNIKSGVGEYRYAGSALDIEKSGIDFNGIKGLYLEESGENKQSLVRRSKMFASEWDDLGFSPDAIASRDWSKGEGEILVEFPGGEVVRTPEYGMEQREEKATDTPKLSEKSELTAKPEESDAVILAVAEVAESEENKESASECFTAQQVTKVPDDWFEKLSRERNHVFLFADDELYDIIEISPEDIERLPETNWGLKNNSFLNHGYFQFRHLILGRMYERENCGYFIGVPGVYSRRDRNTAAMFDFYHFKFSMRSDMRLSQFGYWYRELEC